MITKTWIDLKGGYSKREDGKSGQDAINFSNQSSSLIKYSKKHHSNEKTIPPRVWVLGENTISTSLISLNFKVCVPISRFKTENIDIPMTMLFNITKDMNSPSTIMSQAQ